MASLPKTIIQNGKTLGLQVSMPKTNSILSMALSNHPILPHPNTLNRTKRKAWFLHGFSTPSAPPLLILSTILVMFGSIYPSIFVMAIMPSNIGSNKHLSPYSKTLPPFMIITTKSKKSRMNSASSKTTLTSKLYNNKLVMSECFSSFLA